MVGRGRAEAREAAISAWGEQLLPPNLRADRDALVEWISREARRRNPG